jgi:hypothetical protein
MPPESPTKSWDRIGETALFDAKKPRPGVDAIVFNPGFANWGLVMRATGVNARSLWRLQPRLAAAHVLFSLFLDLASHSKESARHVHARYVLEVGGKLVDRAAGVRYLIVKVADA